MRAFKLKSQVSKVFLRNMVILLDWELLLNSEPPQSLERNASRQSASVLRFEWIPVAFLFPHLIFCVTRKKVGVMFALENGGLPRLFPAVRRDPETAQRARHLPCTLPTQVGSLAPYLLPEQTQVAALSTASCGSPQTQRYKHKLKPKPKQKSLGNRFTSRVASECELPLGGGGK